MPALPLTVRSATLTDLVRSGLIVHEPHHPEGVADLHYGASAKQLGERLAACLNGLCGPGDLQVVLVELAIRQRTVGVRNQANEQPICATGEPAVLLALGDIVTELDPNHPRELRFRRDVHATQAAQICQTLPKGHDTQMSEQRSELLEEARIWLEETDELQFLTKAEREQVLGLLPDLEESKPILIDSDNVRDGLGTLLAALHRQREAFATLANRLKVPQVMAAFRSGSPGNWDNCLVELCSVLTPYIGTRPRSFRRQVEEIILQEEGIEHLVLYSRFPARPEVIWKAARELRQAILEMRRVLEANGDDITPRERESHRKAEIRIVSTFLNATVMADSDRSRRTKGSKQATVQRLTNSVCDALAKHHPEVVRSEIDARAALIVKLVHGAPEAVDDDAARLLEERRRQMMSARFRRHRTSK